MFNSEGIEMTSVILKNDELLCFRTKACNNLNNGKCMFKDSRCTFSHSKVCTRRCPLYLSNTSFIRYMPIFCAHVTFGENYKTTKLNCPNGNKCIYSHCLDELLYHPQFYKTITCENYVNGSCKDTFCPFVHDNSERRPVSYYRLPFTHDMYVPPNKYIIVVDKITQSKNNKRRSDKVKLGATR